MKLIVTRREVRYGGKPYRKGQVVDVAPQHVKLMKLLGKAGDLPGAPVGHVTSTRSLFAADGPSAEAAAAKPKGYRTRRLKAED
ncbi:MAG: hypothetical protein V4466_17700 [Pseudomonadota bacterium]